MLFFLVLDTKVKKNFVELYKYINILSVEISIFEFRSNDNF